MELAIYMMGIPILPQICMCRIEDVIIIFDFNVDNCKLDIHSHRGFGWSKLEFHLQDFHSL